jgi:hypothetical protein
MTTIPTIFSFCFQAKKKFPWSILMATHCKRYLQWH